MRKINIFAVFLGAFAGQGVNILLSFLLSLISRKYYLVYPSWISNFLWRVIPWLLINSFLLAMLSGIVAAYIAREKMMLHGGFAGFAYNLSGLAWLAVKGFSKLIFSFKQGFILYQIIWFCLLFLIAIFGGIIGGEIVKKYTTKKLGWFGQ